MLCSSSLLFGRRTPTAWQIAESSRFAISTAAVLGFLRLRRVQRMRFAYSPAETWHFSSRYEPVPAFVGFICEATITTSYSPSGIGSKPSPIGSTAVASKKHSSMLVFSFSVLGLCYLEAFVASPPALMADMRASHENGIAPAGMP